MSSFLISQQVSKLLIEAEKYHLANSRRLFAYMNTQSKYIFNQFLLCVRKQRAMNFCFGKNTLFFHGKNTSRAIIRNEAFFVDDVLSSFISNEPSLATINKWNQNL